VKHKNLTLILKQRHWNFLIYF